MYKNRPGGSSLPEIRRRKWRFYINDEKKLFQLNTENTTYVIGLSPEGYVGHVYYGPLLHGEPDLYPLRMDEPPFTPCVNKREKSSFLDRFPMEYPTGGVAITVRAV